MSTVQVFFITTSLSSFQPQSPCDSFMCSSCQATKASEAACPSCDPAPSLAQPPANSDHSSARSDKPVNLSIKKNDDK